MNGNSKRRGTYIAVTPEVYEELGKRAVGDFWQTAEILEDGRRRFWIDEDVRVELARRGLAYGVGGDADAVLRVEFELPPRKLCHGKRSGKK